MEALSYQQFLKLLKEIPTDTPASHRKRKTAKEVFEELCFDFPLVNRDELITLKEEFHHQLTNNPNHLLDLNNFKITRRFLNGIIYGATKVDSKTKLQQEDPSLLDEDEQKEETIRIRNATHEEDVQKATLYHSICGLVFLRLFKNMLRQVHIIKG